MDSQEELPIENVPKHVAIIMDGNGRWAKRKGRARIFGHRNALKAVRDTVETAARLHVKYLTLYAFSTENWKRPKREINALMELMVTTINKEVSTLMKNNIRLETIGDLTALPPNAHAELAKAMETTKDNTHMTLVIALSYSAKWELVEATKKIATAVKSGEINPEDVNEELISSNLSTANFPDPELMIRTSGEMRISNFLLWQLAYAELVFLPKLWPDFRGTDLIEAIKHFQQRERRFGMTSEQVKISA